MKGKEKDRKEEGEKKSITTSMQETANLVQEHKRRYYFCGGCLANCKLDNLKIADGRLQCPNGFVLHLAVL